MKAWLLRRDDRARILVGGSDRVRWLDGMISNDVRALAPEGPRSGCQALLLTPQGRIVADLHVWAEPGHLVLELARASADDVVARLDRYVIADDVTLAVADDGLVHLSLEGEDAAAVLEAAAGGPVALAEDGVAVVALAGTEVRVAGYGLASAGGRQLLVAAEDADTVADALVAAGAERADEARLETLRIEHGIPRQGFELDEEVLPAEARLERAVSTTKGCYTGQEVVARMRSRGRVSHLLVGLAFEGGPPEPGTAVSLAGRRVGEVTSTAHSERHGPIGLAFLRSALAESGEALDASGVTARVVALPFDGEAAPG